eukprot:685431-Hanusia_phi.AAC.1
MKLEASLAADTSHPQVSTGIGQSQGFRRNSRDNAAQMNVRSEDWKAKQVKSLQRSIVLIVAKAEIVTAIGEVTRL